jgi:hypothetical protein
MSVLETPRLMFRGQITWDPITTNNYTQQYDEADARANFPTNDEDVAAFRKDAIDAVLTGGNWNPHGTHRATYYDTSVVGVDTGNGLSADDPVVKCPVSFMGMLVDLEPYGSTSSQLFFDEMSFGIQGGCRVYAPRDTRMIARYINFFRNEKYKVIAGVASVVWQTSFPKANGLQIDAHDSPALQLLAKALQDDDVLGLTVRWNAYRTLYYDNPGNMAALAKELHAKLAGGGFQPNPARSELVGVLGLWRKGEPPAEPGERALLAQLQPPTVASAHVRLTADQLTLDLANSIPEIDVNLKKHDYGDLTAVAVAPDGKTVIATLGTFGYDAYGKEAYEASAGIVTLKVDPAAAQKAQTADIQLRQKDGTVLLAETALRAVPITPNIYLDAGDSTTLSVQVLDRGRPAAAGIDVTLVSPNTAADASVTGTTGAQGIATFPLTGETGVIEQYVLWPGQDAPAPQAFDTQQTTYVNVRTLPADGNLADPNQTPPTWDNVQANVLKNWQAMAPCMDNWLDLGNPEQVKSFAPLLHKLTAKENFEAFRYMPVVRDMTAGQRALLYAFLDGPQQPLAMAAKAPPRPSQRRLSRAMRGT